MEHTCVLTRTQWNNGIGFLEQAHVYYFPHWLLQDRKVIQNITQTAPKCILHCFAGLEIATTTQGATTHDKQTVETTFRNNLGVLDTSIEKYLQKLEIFRLQDKKNNQDHSNTEEITKTLESMESDGILEVIERTTTHSMHEVIQSRRQLRGTIVKPRKKKTYIKSPVKLNPGEYGIYCGKCGFLRRFSDTTLAKHRLDFAREEYTKWMNHQYVDLNWSDPPPPASFKKIKAFKAMKKHFETDHKMTEDSLPTLFDKGTEEKYFKDQRKKQIRTIKSGTPGWRLL